MNRPCAQARRIKDIGLVLREYYGLHRAIASERRIIQGNNIPDSRVRWRFHQSSIIRIEHLTEKFKTKAIESRICNLPHDPSVSARIGWQKYSCQHALRQVDRRRIQVSFSETSERVRVRPLTYFGRTVLLDRLAWNPAAPMDKSFAPLGPCPGRSGNPI